MFLEFYVFGERVIGWVCGGGVLNISSPLRGGIKHFPTLLGAKFYGRILEYPPPPPPVHTLYDRSLNISSFVCKYENVGR